MIAHVLRAALGWVVIFTAAVLVCIAVFIILWWASAGPPHGLRSGTDWLRFVGGLFSLVWWLGVPGLIGIVIRACRTYRPAPPRYAPDQVVHIEQVEVRAVAARPAAPPLRR
jgi:hypothetical protein